MDDEVSHPYRIGCSSAYVAVDKIVKIELMNGVTEIKTNNGTIDVKEDIPSILTLIGQ